MNAEKTFLNNAQLIYPRSYQQDSPVFIESIT